MYKVELSNGQTFDAINVTEFMTNRDAGTVHHLRLTVPLSLRYGIVKGYVKGSIESAKVSFFEEDTSPSGYVTAPKLVSVHTYFNIGADASIFANAETSEYEINLFRITPELIEARLQAKDIEASMELICDVYEQTMTV